MPGRRTTRWVACALLGGALLVCAACVSASEQDPLPINTIVAETARDVRNSMIVDGLGKIPLGQIPVALYRVADFSREIGVAAVDKEDRTRDAQIVLLDADAALIQGLVARGEGNSAKAEAAKARLRALGKQLDSGDPGDVNHLLNVTAKHFEYAVGRASLKLALQLGFKRFLKSDPVARFIRKYVHWGKEPAAVIGNRSSLRPWLQQAGWRKFGARASVVERYVDKVTDKLLDKLIWDKMSKEIATASSNALDNLYSRVMIDNPSQPLARRRMRYALAMDPTLYAPLAPVAAAMPMAPLPAVAQAIAIEPLPVAVAQQPILRVSDPVAQAIYLEDSYVRDSWSAPESSEPSTYVSPPQAPPEPEPPTARELELHQELMCVGAGNKAGCERWTTSSEPKAEGSWDGRSGTSVYE